MKLLLALLVSVPASARPPGHGAPPPFSFTAQNAVGGVLQGGPNGPDDTAFTCASGKYCTWSRPRDSKMYLKWVPEKPGTVNSWGGACKNAGEVCVLTMGSDRSVTVYPAEAQKLFVAGVTGGTLRFTSSWKSFERRWGDGLPFDEYFPKGTTVTVTPVPDSSLYYDFGRWDTDCGRLNLTTASCSLPMDSPYRSFNYTFQDNGTQLMMMAFGGQVVLWRASDFDAGKATADNMVSGDARVPHGLALVAKRTLPAGEKPEDYWWTGACKPFMHAELCRFTTQFTRQQVGLQKTRGIVVTPPATGSIAVYVAQFTAQWNQVCSAATPDQCIIVWADGIPMQVSLSVDSNQAKWSGAPNCGTGRFCRFDALPASVNVSVSY